MIDQAARVRSYEELLALINRDQLLHQANPTDSSVRIPTQRAQQEGVILLRWQEHDGVLQFIHPLPLTVRPERIQAMEAAILRLNHVLALPGFGIDHASRQVYFRAAVPIVPDGVSGPAVQSVFRAAVRTAWDLLPALRRVAEEGAPPESIVGDASIDLAMSTDGLPSA